MSPDPTTSEAKTAQAGEESTPSPFQVATPDGADEVVNELLGEDMDWQRLVRTYPTASLLVAFGGGCWLGLRHGSAVFTAVTGYLTHEATRRVQELLGDTGS